MKFIDIKNCYKVYKNGVTAIANLTLSIDKGEFVFVTGASGCGKSTLIKLLYREEKPTKGQVMVGGINVAKLYNSKVYKLRRKLGIVFQDFKLLPKLTVYENIAYPLESFGMKKSEIRERVLKAAERVGLKDKLRSYPHQISGGQKQRTAIARAIVNEPKLIICDEPTGDLDPEMSREIMDVLESINKDLGSTIIMVTHDKDIVNRMKKRVVSFDQGVIVSDKKKGSYILNETTKDN